MTETPPPAEPTPPPAKPRSTWAWPAAIVAVVAILCISPIICISVTTGSILQPFQNLFGGMNQQTTARVSSSQTIVTGIKPLGQIVSMSVQLAKADIGVNVSSGLGNACGFSAFHVSQGTVEAGIDLMRIEEDHITYDEETNIYTLTLPAAQLTSCRVDSIRQYDRSTTACNIDWDEARIIANYKALNDFRDDAIEGGILERAQQQADLVISQFVQLLTGAEVIIEFGDEMAVTPPSCQPSPPDGWSYNAENDQWTKD